MWEQALEEDDPRGGFTKFLCRLFLRNKRGSGLVGGFERLQKSLIVTIRGDDGLERPSAVGVGNLWGFEA